MCSSEKKRKGAISAKTSHPILASIIYDERMDMHFNHVRIDEAGGKTDNNSKNRIEVISYPKDVQSFGVKTCGETTDQSHHLKTLTSKNDRKWLGCTNHDPEQRTQIPSKIAHTQTHPRWFVINNIYTHRLHRTPFAIEH